MECNVTSIYFTYDTFLLDIQICGMEYNKHHRYMLYVPIF